MPRNTIAPAMPAGLLPLAGYEAAGGQLKEQKTLGNELSESHSNLQKINFACFSLSEGVYAAAQRHIKKEEPSPSGLNRATPRTRP